MQMQEPTITSYEHPLSKRDREDIGAVNLKEFNAIVGFYTTAITSQGLVYTTVPPSLGKMRATILR